MWPNVKFSGLLSLADLAARRRPRASGPSRASRASCILTMASARCSSRGVSDVASNGTMPSVSDSDSCSRNTARWTLEHILIITFVKAPNRGMLFSTLAHTQNTKQQRKPLCCLSRLTLTWKLVPLSSSSTIFQVSSRASGLFSEAEGFLLCRDFFRLTLFFCGVNGETNIQRRQKLLFTNFNRPANHRIL